MAPLYRVPTANTFRYKHIPAIIGEVVDDLKTILEGTEYVHVTTDAWKSISNDQYLALTGHFVGTDGRLHERCLELIKFAGGLGSDYADAIQKALNTWGLNPPS